VISYSNWVSLVIASCNSFTKQDPPGLHNHLYFISNSTALERIVTIVDKEEKLPLLDHLRNESLSAKQAVI
jgi:hypothetical protein